MIIHNINVPKDKNFIVAISGGADSFCLALLANIFAKQNGLTMTAVFVDHKLRSESGDEFLPIIDTLNKNGIKNTILTWNHDKNIGGNLEKKAREARYKLLTDFCKENNINTILTAHHALDQWETFFMRLSRGSGMSGLCSMRERSKYMGVDVIRPLLIYSPEDIKETLREKFGVSHYVIDPMNKDESYERVRWRHRYELFSNEYNLNSEKIGMSISRMQKADNCLDEIANKSFESCFTQGYIDVNIFKKLHSELQIRVLKKIIEHVSAINKSTRTISYSLLNRVCEKMIEQNFTAINIAGCVFRRDKTKNIKVIVEKRV